MPYPAGGRLATIMSRFMGRLSVSRKLMLIYLLDLSAVIFVSGILIHEKFIAINFARKEITGAAYLAEVSTALVKLAQGEVNPDALVQAQQRHGPDMKSDELSRQFVESLRELSPMPLDAGRRRIAFDHGRALLTRIANQSNLILDPDLDSYYTMSVALLRYPELLDIVLQMSAQARQAGTRGDSRYLVLEDRLATIVKAIESDLSEAFAAAGDDRLKNALATGTAQLFEDIDRFRRACRESMPGSWSSSGPQVEQRWLLETFASHWAAAISELDRLLHERVTRFFNRMWWHLGTALSLLLLILTAVFFVARQITRPLRCLSDVADEVKRTGDHSLRAVWPSEDEIGRLMMRFNGMLAELGEQRAVQQELASAARAAQAQQRLVEDFPMPLMVTEIPGHDVLHANTPAQAWLGGLKRDPWANGLEGAVRARFFQELSDRGCVTEFKVRWHGGREPTWAVLSARQLVYQGRNAVVTAFTPITQLKQMEARLELWAKVFESSSESILIMNADRRILTVNPAFRRQTGYEATDVLGQAMHLLCADREADMHAAMWAALDKRGSWQGEMQLRRRTDSTYPAWVSANAVREKDGAVSHYICSSLDITDRKASEAQIHYLAHHDVLTGLPNRTLFTERLRLAIQHARRDQQRVAVLFIDLDRFKTINDSLGHHVGDALLKSVSQRLQEIMRDGDTVSRFGGDEFVVALSGVAGTDDISNLVERRLIPLIRTVHRAAGADLHVSCSVGIAIFPDDSRDIDELMRHADAAMYQAKASGRDSAQFFKPELNERAHRRLRIESCLRQAIERNELSLHYQPRVSAKTGDLVAVEALLRWHSAELGPMSPAEFISVAEESRLIVPIGAWVIVQACRQQAQWRRQGIGNLRVSINLSAVQLRDASLVEHLSDAMKKYHCDPSTIELELTESMLLESVGETMEQLNALKKLNVQLAIDDFGTGYSSLTYLHRFPIDRLKIDQSFVRDVMNNKAHNAITHAIIGLGHALGLEVVAEGVESESVACLLRDAGCNELQGFHFARPLPPDGLVAWVRQARAATRAQSLSR